MNKLRVLMWHHSLVRLRKFIRTYFEFGSTVMFFILFFLYRYVFMTASANIPKSNGELNIHYTEPLHLNNTKPLSLVLYSPSTQLTDILMDVAGTKLGIRRLSSFPAPKARGYYALDNISSSDLDEIVLKMKDNFAIVKFMNMEGAEFPVNLNYTIRMNVDFMVQIYRSLDEDVGPHRRFGTIYEPFIRLQWAFDSSFLQLRTNQNVDREIYLQEIPFADSVVYPDAFINGVYVYILAWMSLMLPYIFLMQSLMEYRMTGLEELIKMVGVNPATLRLSHFLNMLPVGFLFAVINPIILKMSSRPILLFSNIFLISFLFLLFFILIVLFAFITSHVSQSNQYAASFACLSFFGLNILVLVITKFLLAVPILLRLVVNLLVPTMPFYAAFINIIHFEMVGRGLSWNTLFTSKIHISCFGCYVLLILQIFILLGVGWYIAHVRPGKYGVARPYNFLCKRSYWRRVSPTESDELMVSESADAEPIARDPNLFEAAPHNLEVGIKIVDVSKVYGKKTVLSKVNLEVYKGEITVLLGHNGAGKTTLMSVITGMTSMTRGSVYVNGESVGLHPERVRRHLGLCTQHNLTVPGLNVLQHTLFFAMLKGQSYVKAKEQSKSLLKRLGLESKFTNLASELSGGMKRRLQLACAIVGGATVLILDEPTSGLDIETRRELWDLLLSLRGEHTVLLTTHFMEEADALGDRVVALHDGVTRCHATPMFLKKAIGTGYRLSLTTAGLPQEQAITNVITSVVPEAVMHKKSFNSIIYNLPSHESSKFPSLFSTLESKRSDLNIETIGVGLSTLEDVFVQLCSNVETVFTEDSVDTSVPRTTLYAKKGVCHYFKMTGLLMIRQFRYLAHKMCTFLCIQTIMPVFLILMITEIFAKEETNDDTLPTSAAMDMHMYRGMDMDGGYLVMLRGQGAATPILRTLEPKYSNVKFETTQDDIASNMLNNMMSGVATYDKYLAGIELNSTHAKVLYTTALRHAAPTALNLLSNIIAGEVAPGSSIAVYNEPLQGGSSTTPLPDPELPISAEQWDSWVLLICIVYLTTLSSALALPLAERRLGTRHIHLMAGCPPALHWLATLAAQSLIYTGFLLVPTLFCFLLDQKQTINTPPFVGAFFVIFLVGTMSTLASMYFLHFMTDSASTIFNSIALLGGAFPALIFSKMQSVTVGVILRATFAFLRYTCPPYTLTSALLKAVVVARDNALCNLNQNLCPSSDARLLVCCDKGKNPFSYYKYDKNLPLGDIFILLGQLVVYMALVILTEYGLIGPLWEKIWVCLRKKKSQPPTDPMVLAEQTYVDKAIDLPNKQIPDAMLVSRLCKSYCQIDYLSVTKVWTTLHAVKDLSFSVKRGECFGLLGVNGAGKSTTFKMITGETAATRGRCFANERRLQFPKMPYLKSLGYCPQFFGMDEFLTGRENLRLLFILRGIRRDKIPEEVNKWLEISGLQNYADQKVATYSGGCARRLAASAALAMGAAITLLDEPTAGVDVAARRRVWLAVRHGLADNRAVVLTSHSMDEMEALCNRIGIMSGGRLVALGSAAALRAAHASGHSVAIKVKSVPEPAAPAPPATSATAAPPPPADDPLGPLKSAMGRQFPCRLTDQHKTMLHYDVDGSVRYSELFRGLEELKGQFVDVIEDYTVTETTLEEVFLSYAPKATAAAAAAAAQA